MLKEALEEVNKDKRARYEAWRRRALSRNNSLGRRLRRMVMWTVVPAVIALNIGRAGVKVDDVKRNAGRVWSVVGRVVPKNKKEVAEPAAKQPAPVPEPEPQPQPSPEPPKKFGWF